MVSRFVAPLSPMLDSRRKLLTPKTTEALEAATASLSVEAQKRAAKDAQKKTAKAEAAEAKQADKLAKSVITIKRIERNKRKFVTAVIGLETFGLDLKKVLLRENHLLTTQPRAARYRLWGLTTDTLPPSCSAPRTLAKSLPRARPSQRSPAAARRLWCRAT